MARKFLDTNGVEYIVSDVDIDHESESMIMTKNSGKRVVPTFEIEGMFYFNPSLLELARLLNIDQ